MVGDELDEFGDEDVLLGDELEDDVAANMEDELDDDLAGDGDTFADDDLDAALDSIDNESALGGDEDDEFAALLAETA